MVLGWAACKGTNQPLQDVRGYCVHGKGGMAWVDMLSPNVCIDEVRCACGSTALRCFVMPRFPPGLLANACRSRRQRRQRPL